MRDCDVEHSVLDRERRDVEPVGFLAREGRGHGRVGDVVREVDGLEPAHLAQRGHQILLPQRAHLEEKRVHRAADEGLRAQGVVRPFLAQQPAGDEVLFQPFGHAPGAILGRAGSAWTDDEGLGQLVVKGLPPSVEEGEPESGQERDEGDDRQGGGG